MNFEQLFHKYGLKPSAAELPELRGILVRETALERVAQGKGDTEVMRLVAAQLFNAGDVADVLLISAAKRSSVDANGAIDIEMLCVGGVKSALAFLRSSGANAAKQAETAICQGLESGALDGFTVDDYSAFLTHYYSEVGPDDGQE